MPKRGFNKVAKQFNKQIFKKNIKNRSSGKFLGMNLV